MAIIDKKDFMKKLSAGDLKNVGGGTEEDFWKEVDKLYVKYGVSTMDELNKILTEEDFWEILWPAWFKEAEDNTEM